MSVLAFIKLALIWGPGLRELIAMLITTLRDEKLEDVAKSRKARELFDRIEFMARQRL
jgi:hypothetical protein